SVPAHDLANLNNPNKFSLPPGAPGFSRFIPDALTTSGTPGDAGNTIAARADLLTAIGVATLPNGAPLLPGLAALPSTSRDLIRHVIFPDVLRIDLAIAPPGASARGAELHRVAQLPRPTGPRRPPGDRFHRKHGRRRGESRQQRARPAAAP